MFILNAPQLCLMLIICPLETVRGMVDVYNLEKQTWHVEMGEKK